MFAIRKLSGFDVLPFGGIWGKRKFDGGLEGNSGWCSFIYVSDLSEGGVSKVLFVTVTLLTGINQQSFISRFS